MIVECLKQFEYEIQKIQDNYSMFSIASLSAT